MKKKGRKAFWHNFKFKYKLTITNENTLEEIVGADSAPLSSRRIREDFLAIYFLLSLHGTAAAIPPRLC